MTVRFLLSVLLCCGLTASTAGGAAGEDDVKDVSRSAGPHAPALLPSVFDTPLDALGPVQSADGPSVLPIGRVEPQPKPPEASPAQRAGFADLAGEAAEQLAVQTFPGLFEVHESATEAMPDGWQVVRYSSPFAAQVRASDGNAGVIESMEPMTGTAPIGTIAPIDLKLSRHGETFAAAVPAVELTIPTQLSDGVALPDHGLTVTPVAADGAPLRATGQPAGDATVIYPNSEPDTDTLVQPLAMGVRTDTLLRSPDSPEELRFAIGMPSGATLKLGETVHQPIEIARDDQPLATIMPIWARDATGRDVPVDVAVDGQTLRLTVSHRDKGWAYPIHVDPEAVVADGTMPSGNTNWYCRPSVPGFTCSQSAGRMLISVAAGQHLPTDQMAEWIYETRGTSRIYYFHTYSLEFPRFDGHLMAGFAQPERMSVDAEDPAVFGGVPS